ncbi:hypothetical protein [Vibrio parahaemolyticus]|uniref:hypothetical protein n=1 Tax=Vibrio parahaemolyticus TaxID=670 RepID=UPI001F39130B|nr:hypothetical protein [Vibrio parahaemolyticus]
MDLLQGSKALLGQDVIIEEVPQSVIDEALATFSDTQHQTLKEQGEQKCCRTSTSSAVPNRRE